MGEDKTVLTQLCASFGPRYTLLMVLLQKFEIYTAGLNLRKQIGMPKELSSSKDVVSRQVSRGTARAEFSPGSWTRTS